MTKREHAQFIRALHKNMQEWALKKCQEGRIPAAWDGHELRLWLGEAWAREITSTMRKGRTPRVKSFRSDCYNNNL